MASGGKRGGAGERVLEGRHVIGLFMLMMLFSGVFFTLGYVMGRNQYDGQVRAATDVRGKPGSSISPKPDVVPKRTNNSAPTEAPTDTAAPANSDWEFYHAGENRKTEDHLKPIAPPGPVHKNAPVLVRTRWNSRRDCRRENSPRLLFLRRRTSITACRLAPMPIRRPPRPPGKVSRARASKPS